MATMLGRAGRGLGNVVQGRSWTPSQPGSRTGPNYQFWWPAQYGSAFQMEVDGTPYGGTPVLDGSLYYLPSYGTSFFSPDSSVAACRIVQSGAYSEWRYLSLTPSSSP